MLKEVLTDYWAQREYSNEFPELEGEDVELCLPSISVPDGGLEDFTECEA